LDLLRVEAVVLRELGDRLSSAVSLGDDSGLDASAGDDRLPKTATGIDDDALRSLQVGAYPRVEPLGNIPTPLNALKAGIKDFAQKSLFRARYIEQLPRMIHEEAHTIRTEARVDERTLHAELAADVAQRLPDALHRDSVNAPHRRQHESLDQIGK